MSKPQKPLSDTVRECLQTRIEGSPDDLQDQVGTTSPTSTAGAATRPKREYHRRQGHPELTEAETERLQQINTDIISAAINTADVESMGISYTIKDRLYLQAFLDPESPTYLDRTASYRRIYPESKAITDRTIQQYTYHKLKRYRQAGLIAAYLHAIDMEIQRRLGWLKPIMTGTALRETKQYTRVQDKTTGEYREVLSGRTVSTPSFQERIKAIDLVNKMTGEYDKRRIEANEAGQQLKALRKQALDDIRKTRDVLRGAEPVIDSADTDDIDDAVIEYDNAALLPAEELEIYDTRM
jgi:hypothetical protein